MQVVIDDRLPVSHSGELLCSHSSNRDEFWVSLIEKAYMKVMVTYDDFCVQCDEPILI